MAAKNLFACCFPLTRFRREKKKDASTQVGEDDFFDRSEKLQTPVIDTNPFANMSINPFSNAGGLFPSPFFGRELMDEIKNPFLDQKRKITVNEYRRVMDSVVILKSIL
ncbi:hypothetical protein AVEN_215823-1 [Araneus ventricosus]|uniref:Uncharacterized protein n=1 Tax=Araneus ventricosus TaxID=182803 RepID=A0A4Y2L0S0_ARAVE|nr:hypothetical protein AVEN_215823-1 [Araneus ventricosus]